MVIEFLNDHLSKNCSEEEQNNSKIDSLQAAIIKYNHQNSCLSEDVLDWHTMCRLEEEVILLEEEDKRFVRNLSKKLVLTKLALQEAKPEHLYLLKQEHLKLLTLKRLAELFLAAPFVENIAEEASLSDVEVIQSDDHVGGGIFTEEENDEEAEEEEENGDEEEDELALLVEAVEEQ